MGFTLPIIYVTDMIDRAQDACRMRPYIKYKFQTIVTPLSTGITCPVVIADSSPAKYTANSAIWIGSPNPSKCVFAIVSIAGLAASSFFTRSDKVTEGAIALTLILSFCN